MLMVKFTLLENPSQLAVVGPREAEKASPPYCEQAPRVEGFVTIRTPVRP